MTRDFRLLWAGQALSTLGDAFAFVAMPLLVLDLTGSVAQMGYVTAIGCAGQIGMSLVAGVIVDRAHRRLLMILSDIGRMVLFASLPVAFALGAPSLWLVDAVAAATAALGNLFSVGYVTAVANVVDKDRLADANSRLQATQALTYAVGPVLAGAVCARWGPLPAIACDAASFGISAASLTFVRFRREKAERGPTAAKAHPLRELGAGLAFLFRQPVLRAITGINMASGLLASVGLSAAVVDLLVFRLRRDLGQTSGVVGICLGLSAFGAFAGAVLAPRIQRRLGFGACFLGGMGLQAIGLAWAGTLPLVASVIVGATLWSAGLTLRAVTALAKRQELTPDALLGRATAASWTMIFGAATAGAVLVTHVAALVGTGRALLAVGAGLAVVVAAGSRTAVIERPPVHTASQEA